MQIILVGLNHETAPVEIRERVAFQPKRLGDPLGALIQPHKANPVTEAVILSTCNRIEIYAAAEDLEEGVTWVEKFLADFHDMPLETVEPHLYKMANLQVVEHLFSVTSGINSMVLGETQIQGQVKQALEAAQRHRTAGTLLSALFRHALAVGKRARRETGISEHPVSVSQAAVNLVRNSYADLSQLKVVMVGLGKMGLLAAERLLKYGVRSLSVVNRTEDRARDLTSRRDLEVVGFDGLDSRLADADVVITCTGAPHVVLTYERVARAVSQRGGRGLLIIDIAVPRDVDPEVSRLPAVRLFNIDELKSQVDGNLERRCSEITKVRDIIGEEVEAFQNWFQSLQVKPVITDLRKRADAIREREVARALRRLQGELSEHDGAVLQELSRRIVNKILHQPIVSLREQAMEGNGQVYAATVRALFGLREKSQ